jgi:hypothetical protein
VVAIVKSISLVVAIISKGKRQPQRVEPRPTTTLMQYMLLVKMAGNTRNVDSAEVGIAVAAEASNNVATTEVVIEDTTEVDLVAMKMKATATLLMSSLKQKESTSQRKRRKMKSTTMTKNNLLKTSTTLSLERRSRLSI